MTLYEFLNKKIILDLNDDVIIRVSDVYLNNYDEEFKSVYDLRKWALSNEDAIVDDDFPVAIQGNLLTFYVQKDY